VLWAPEANWRQLITNSTNHDLDKIDDRRTLIFSAKLTYFAWHEITVNDIQAPLTPLGLIDTGDLKYDTMAEILKEKQAKWQHTLMTRLSLYLPPELF
jgi:hypothetical protein